TDAIFTPLVARQLTRATAAGQERVNNETLLQVADSYFNVLRARRRLARVGETLTYLTAEEPKPDPGRFQGLLPLVRAHVEVGGKEAFKSDLARVEVEILRRREEWAGGLLELRVASAELARLLRLDPATRLSPLEDIRVAIPLPGQE